MMIDINPFCDSDIRNGLQFLSGINLIIIAISIIVDGLAIWEVEEYADTWESSTFLAPVYVGIILLGLDILINLLLLISGWTLYSSVSNKTYGKISKLFYISLAFSFVEMCLLISYLVCIPSSPFFYYFSLFTFLYKAFLLWPTKKYINEHSQHNQRPRIGRRQPNERTRLLASVA